MKSKRTKKGLNFSAPPSADGLADAARRANAAMAAAGLLPIADVEVCESVEKNLNHISNRMKNRIKRRHQ